MAHNKNSFSSKCKKLLEYFQNPAENMRTFVSPEKNSAITDSSKLLPVKASESTPSRAEFSRALSAASLTEPEITPMPRARVDIARPNVITSPIVNVGDRRDEDIAKLSGGRYKSHERHHFATVNYVTYASYASPSGIYSEIAVTLWLDNKHFSKFSSDRYRAVISLMYASDDDLWSVSAKLIKRCGMYTTKDEDEGTISNRLCFASELSSEIKKMLLFLGICPKNAYRQFRYSMNDELVFNQSEYGFSTVETESHIKFMKDLDKPIPYNAASNSYEGSGYNNFNRHSRHHGYPHNGLIHRDNDKEDAYKNWQEAMMAGYCGD